MKQWLSRAVETRSYPFVVDTYIEKIGWTSAGVASEMGALLSESTASRKLIDRVSGIRGWNKKRAKTICIVEMQPDNDNVKKGKFGEVLHGAILEQFCGMVVACHRYQYSPDPNVSPPGLDIIALAPHDGGKGDRIVYAETKVRLNADGGALGKALGQLLKVRHKNLPGSLKTTMHALISTNPLLFERVVRATGVGAPNPHYRIGAIFEAKIWSDSQLRQIVNKYDKQCMNLTVDVVKIDALESLIKESYDKVGVI